MSISRPRFVVCRLQMHMLLFGHSLPIGGLYQVEDVFIKGPPFLCGHRALLGRQPAERPAPAAAVSAVRWSEAEFLPARKRFLPSFFVAGP